MNPLRMTPSTVRIAGHRGHSIDAPENTLAAFRLARQLGGHHVTCETDLTMTVDGELILLHDETVDRTTNGHGLARNMTYSEISRLDAGSWSDASFAHERVPRLIDALTLGRELDIIFQVELKIHDRNDEIFAKLKALKDEFDRGVDLLQFSSFDFLQLRALKHPIPYVPTVGLSHSRLLNSDALAAAATVDAIALEIQHFSSGEPQELHEAGCAVFVLVPRSEILEKLKRYGGPDVEALVARGIRQGLLDQIIGDDVAQMVRIKRASESCS